MTVDDLHRDLVLLPPPSEGSVLVWRETGLTHDDMEHKAAGIFRYYQSFGLPVPLIIWLHDDQTVELLDQEAMAEHGWVKKP